VEVRHSLPTSLTALAIAGGCGERSAIMGEREERLVRNEALFRSVNETIRRTVEFTVGEPPDAFEIFCECGRGDCMQKLTVSATDYEAVRRVPTRFLIVTGHEIPEIEHVVISPGGYVIVEKSEPEAVIARGTDPRSE
jgi:hypothetical protein